MNFLGQYVFKNNKSELGSDLCSPMTSSVACW